MNRLVTTGRRERAGDVLVAKRKHGSERRRAADPAGIASDQACARRATSFGQCSDTSLAGESRQHSSPLSPDRACARSSRCGNTTLAPPRASCAQIRRSRPGVSPRCSRAGALVCAQKAGPWRPGERRRSRRVLRAATPPATHLIVICHTRAAAEAGPPRFGRSSGAGSSARGRNDADRAPGGERRGLDFAISAQPTFTTTTAIASKPVRATCPIEDSDPRTPPVGLTAPPDLSDGLTEQEPHVESPSHAVSLA